MIYEDKLYGKQEINDELALSIIKTPEMQRLKGVNQYGVWKYLTPWMNTTRFEHCLGVYFLLRNMGASREEQIAGLIHDIGHTAFSHAYDYVVGRSELQDSNDESMAAIVINSSIKHLLTQEGIDVTYIIDHNNFPLLEKDLPDLCADRIDYVLRDSLCYGLLDKKETSKLLESIKTKNDHIFLSDQQAAKKLALIFMDMDNSYWRSPTQSAIYHLFGEALKIAIKRKIVTFEDFFYTDEYLMGKLKASCIPEIISRLNLINPSIKIKNDDYDYDFFIRGKCRYIDPKVMTSKGLSILSELDPQINTKIQEFRKEHIKGHHIKILNKVEKND